MKYHCPSCHYPYGGPAYCFQCSQRGLPCEAIPGDPPAAPVDDDGLAELRDAAAANMGRIRAAHIAAGWLDDEGRAVAAVGDKLEPVFDNAAGRSFTSKAERKRFYKDHQLRRVSLGEAKQGGYVQDHSCMGRTTSFAGQTDRRTASERTPNH